MKKSMIFILFLIFSNISILYSSSGYPGAENTLSLDAKMMSLSGSFDSISSGIESIYFNPSGLAHLQKLSFSCSYMPIWDNLTTVYYISAGVPNDFIPFGIGLLNISSDGIAIRSDSPEISQTVGYRDISFFISGGYSLLNGLSTGLRLKLNYKSVLGYNNTGIGADASLLWRRENPYAFTKNSLLKIFQPVSIGIILYNIFPASVNLNGSKENYPLIIKSSLSYRFPKLFNFLDPEIGAGVETVPAFGASYFNAGGEFILWKYFFMRGGYRITDKVLTIGTGLRMWDIMLEYGMSSLQVSDSHYILDLKVEF
ncbi:MAG: hypothetical protein KKH98_15625 [Spirochaetes bacterium]|nr:hypothetical protein [Spirochaetota bacterium]